MFAFSPQAFSVQAFSPAAFAIDAEAAVSPPLTFHPDYTYATAAMLGARRRPGGFEEDEALVLLLMQ